MPQAHPSQEAPDWRYAVACAELHNEAAGLPVHAACEDFSVKHLKRVLSLMRNRAVPASLVEATLGGICELVHWYEHEADMRFFLEALILGRADDETICDRLGKDILPPMLQLYRSWFFDVAEHLDHRLWIEARVLRPALYRAQSEAATTKRSRLHLFQIWKTFGYYIGYEKLEMAMASGMIYDLPTTQLLRKFCISKNLRSVMSSLDNPGHDEFGLQQHAQVHGWDAENLRAEKDAPGADDEVAGQMTEALSLRLNPASPGDKVEEIERVATPTYTEKDLPDVR